MNVKMLFVLLLGVNLVGCGATPNYDYDNSIDFEQLTTYAWVVESTTPVNNNSFYLSNLSHRRITHAIDNNLMNKGLIKVAPAQADVLVNYHATIDKKLESYIEPSHRFYWRFGHHYHSNHLGWGYDFHHRLREYKEGILMIDIINNEKQLIWRGVKGSRLASKQTPAQRWRSINETVTAILENFPPRT